MVREHFVMPYREKQALRIISCESGFRRTVQNSAGYWGLFQFGDSERETWDWGVVASQADARRQGLLRR